MFNRRLRELKENERYIGSKLKPTYIIAVILENMLLDNNGQTKPKMHLQFNHEDQLKQYRMKHDYILTYQF